ncbi:multidrug transporter [Paenibacillus sp. FSL R7-0273]|uniref:MFS transporter n=1 Tax=Paenibacillus sp. FSL R7-0273 TaxID=1536772 RepID=UPI0004F79F16|nr:MFS transporter [Paenibacillus sp. FSL R7-0273]AIQ47271.1 multidrug transporter [Paenibacillus sp. FSL R7-0273]OMF91586.1 MFS transporter [Paenibacillus sp. FSL R7-0273]
MRSLSKSANFPLFILMLNLFIALLGQGMVIPILPEYLKLFNAAGAAAGYLIAAFGAAQFIFSPIGGQLADRLGRKPMLIAGLLLTVISDLMFAVGDSLAVLYIARFIGGIGVGIMVPANMAYVADITTPDTRAKGMGYLGAAMNLGMVLGPGLGGLIAELGIRVPYFFAGGLGFIAMLLCFFMPETLPKAARTAAKPRGQGESFFSMIRNSFRTSYFQYLLLILIITFGLMNYETVYALFVEQKYGYDAAQISVLITVGAVIGIIVQIWLLDRFIKKLGEMKLIRISLLMTAAALLLMLFKVNLGYLLAVSGMFFAFNAFLRPTLSTIIANSAGDRQGYAAGLNTTYTSIGSILGPVIAGQLFDWHIHMPYILGAAILASALLLTAHAQHNKPERTAAHD